MPVPALKQHWREKGGGQLRKKERKRRMEIVDTRDPEKIFPGGKDLEAHNVPKKCMK